MDFVIIANAWAAVQQNPTSKHQVAMELARCGHRVLWLDGTGMRQPTLGSSADRSRILEKIRLARTGTAKVQENLWCAAPLVVPFPKSAIVRRLNAWIYRAVADRLSAQLYFWEPTLINFLPVIPAIYARWPGMSVYYCVDRWESFSQYDTNMMRGADEACMRDADLVVTTSLFLQNRALKINTKSLLLPHGVDVAHFRGAMTVDRRPADFPAGKAIIGFVGLISEWVDQELIALTARKNPAALIAMVGTSDVDTSTLRTLGNVTMTGPKPYLYIPEYIGSFAVGMIPFKVNDLTRAVNPIKLREMLAAGCPVVSTRLPEVEHLQKQLGLDAARALTICDTAEEFSSAVQQYCEHPLSREERQRISEAMSNETWTQRVETLTEALRSG